MGLEWDLESIKNNKELCWEHTTDPELVDEEEGWQEIEDDVYVRLNPKTYALILASDGVHLSSIRSSNLIEWKYRLDTLFDLGEYYLFTDSADGDIPIRIRFSDLKPHVGLKTSATTWSKEKFDKYIRETRMKHILSSPDVDF